MGRPLDPVIEDWSETNVYHHTDFQLSHLASTVKANKLKVIVIIPAKEVATTIAGVIQETIGPLATAGIVSSTFVIDANSKDRTGEVAARHGARVIQRAEIAPELGPSLGKGDALWRALKVTDGDIVAFLDGDTGDPHPAHLLGILGPLLLDENIQMVRGCFDRPFQTPNGDLHPNEGGRVTELTARPLLNLHFPQLAGFRQPLAGEFATRRSLLEQLSFPVGYGIEIGTLIDAWKIVGLNRLAEVDLGTRQNAHKPLRDLSPMAVAVMNTVERRRGNLLPGMIYLPWEERFHDVSSIERPPLQFYKSQTNGTSNHCHVVNGKTTQSATKIPGVLNFRDIGGSPTSSGSHTRRNLVFRSADPSGLSIEGKAQLQERGIGKVFDLRTLREIKEHMVQNSVYETWLSKGPERSIVPIFQREDFTPDAVAHRLAGYSDRNTEGPVRVYRSILVNSGPALKVILSYLCSSKSPAPCLINCTAGKDRTGIIVMVLMLLAGCSSRDVAKEFHLSEEGLGTKWKTEAVSRLSQKPPFVGKDPILVERAVGARKEVMRAVVKMVEKEWGGIENFLLQELHISVDMLTKTKMALKD